MGCLPEPAANLQLQWRSPEELLIVCHSCELPDSGLDEGSWGKLRIRYDLSGPERGAIR